MSMVICFLVSNGDHIYLPEIGVNNTYLCNQ